jgi:hypothetical protein
VEPEPLSGAVVAVAVADAEIPVVSIKPSSPVAEESSSGPPGPKPPVSGTSTLHEPALTT